MKLSVGIENRSRDIESFFGVHSLSLTLRGFVGKGASGSLVALNITQILHKHGGERHRDDEPHEASEFAADNKSQDRNYGWYPDDFAYY